MHHKLYMIINEREKVRLKHSILLAGVEGFEPPNAGTKSRCLTTWRHPIGQYRLYTKEGVGSSKNQYSILLITLVFSIVSLWTD